MRKLIKNRHIDIRITQDDLKSFTLQAEDVGLDLSKWAYNKLLNDQSNSSGTFDRRILKMTRKHKTEIYYNLYHVKNTLKTILDISKASFIVSHGKEVHMQPVVRIINEAEFVYNAMPDADKKALAPSMKNLLKLKDRDYLLKTLGFNRQIEDRKNNVSFIDVEKVEDDLHKKLTYKEDVDVKK